MQQPDHFLLVEPDKELREIVVAEMRAAVALPVRSCGLEECRAEETSAGAIAVSLPSKAAAVRQALPAGVELLTLSVQSAGASLAPWVPGPSGVLVGIASRWPEFLKLAHTMLLAAGFPAEGLVVRDARKPNWRRGLRETAGVVCESVSALELPKECRAIVFRLLADGSLQELQSYEKLLREAHLPAV